MTEDSQCIVKKAKLSSNRIKELISEWLSKPEMRKGLRHHSDMEGHPERIVKGYGGQTDMTALAYTCNLFEAPEDSTEEQLEEHIWKLWCDGSRWKREEKRALKDEAEDTFSDTQYIGKWKEGLPGNQQERRKVPWFPNDLYGDHNVALATKYFNDLKLAEKCVYREFIPNNQLSDNYRLEVITTHDDSEVVGWWVTVD